MNSSIDRKEIRKQEAIERQAKRDSLTDQQQLDKLIRNGHGHCKEADRLRERIKKND